MRREGVKNDKWKECVMAIADELLRARPEGIEPKIYAFSIDHP